MVRVNCAWMTPVHGRKIIFFFLPKTNCVRLVSFKRDYSNVRKLYQNLDKLWLIVFRLDRPSCFTHTHTHTLVWRFIHKQHTPIGHSPTRYYYYYVYDRTFYRSACVTVLIFFFSRSSLHHRRFLENAVLIETIGFMDWPTGVDPGNHWRTIMNRRKVTVVNNYHSQSHSKNFAAHTNGS